MNFTFVELPEFINLLEVSVVELSVEELRRFIVKFAIALELIVFPFPIICNFVGLIVQNPIPIHLILLPLPIITASVLVEKLSSTMPHAIQLVTDVLAALLEDLLNMMWLFF